MKIIKEPYKCTPALSVKKWATIVKHVLHIINTYTHNMYFILHTFTKYMTGEHCSIDMKCHHFAQTGIPADFEYQNSISLECHHLSAENQALVLTASDIN